MSPLQARKNGLVIVLLGVVVIVVMAALLLIAVEPAGALQVGRSQTDEAVIGGSITTAEAEPVVGQRVELWTALLDGGSDSFIRPAFSDGDGTYRFENLPADCYVVIITAPARFQFADGGTEYRAASCVDPGQSDLLTGTVLAPVDEVDPLDPDAFRVSLLHMGDHRSNLRARVLDLVLDDEPYPVEVGGMARAKAKMADIEATLEAGTTLKIHSGDALGGTMFYSAFGGAADAAAMNSICFDLFGFGHRDRGTDQPQETPFLDFLADGDCGTEVLERPADVGGDRRPVAERNFGEAVVGFVMVDDQRFVAPTSGGERWPSDAEQALATTAESIQADIDALVAEGIVNIVLVSQLGLDGNVALVAELSDVDGVVGGGGDALLGEFESLGLVSDGAYPVRAVNRSGDAVCIGHAGRGGTVVGQLVLTFDETNRITDCGGAAHLLLGQGPEAGVVAVAPDTVVPDTVVPDTVVPDTVVPEAVVPDAGLAATVAGYGDALDQVGAKVIGEAIETFCLTGVPGRSVGLLCGPDISSDSTVRPRDVQRLVADGVRTRLDGADIAIIHSGAVTGGVPAGAITVDHAYRLLPHRHTLTLLNMTGAEIVATLEASIEAAIGPEGTGSAYPHAIGLRWATDLAAEAGVRTADVMVRPQGLGRWVGLEPEAFYVVVTLSTLVDGEPGYEPMADVAADGRALATPVGYTQAFIDYLEHDLVGIVSPFRSDTLN